MAVHWYVRLYSYNDILQFNRKYHNFDEAKEFAELKVVHEASPFSRGVIVKKIWGVKEVEIQKLIINDRVFVPLKKVSFWKISVYNDRDEMIFQNKSKKLITIRELRKFLKGENAFYCVVSAADGETEIYRIFRIVNLKEEHKNE